MAAQQVFDRSPDGFISTRGLTLRVRVCGKGTPLLLINGLGGCLEGWQTLADRLPGRRFIAVDHPGSGCSQVPERFMTIRDLAAIYLDVMDQLEITAFDVLGFSFGGTVAQQLAKDYPDRVEALILAATSCGHGGFPADPFTLLIASNPMRYQFQSVRELSAPLLYRGRVGREPGLLGGELRGWGAHRASLLGVFYQVAAYSVWSSLAWLPTLTVPTLVLGGGEDPMAPVANARLLASKIPSAQLHVVEDGGHMLLFDQAAEVAPVITAFLDRLHDAAVA